MLTSNQITYIGHATLRLTVDGMSLLTDPLLRNRILHLTRRSVMVEKSLYQDIDIVIISHVHGDHFDIPSLRLIDRKTTIFAPKGTKGRLARQGYTKIFKMEPGDQHGIGSLTIETTQAQHGSRFQHSKSPQGSLGYLIKGSQTIYFPGDTDIFPGMADLSNGLDIALLPVWGWGPTLGDGHMNPKRAAEALTLLKPRIAIPIHWGTFYPIGLGWLRSHLLLDPPHIFQQEAAKLMPEVEVHILTPGSSFRIPKIEIRD